MVGVGAGVATGLAYVAYRNRDAVPCAKSADVIVLQPGQEFACGGPAPGPWLVAAIVLVTVSAGTCALALWHEGKHPNG